MATSAAADGEDGLRWADWWPCFTLTKPSSPLRSPPHGWCWVIDGLGFDRVWSPRKLTSARTLSSSSILRRDRQNGTIKNKEWKSVSSLPCCPSCLARVATVSNLFLKRRTCSQFSIASSCGVFTEAKLYQHGRPKYTVDSILYS